MNPIKTLLIEYGQNDGWYNAKKILPSFDVTMVFWIIGERRIGKTDLFLRLACDLWQRFRLKTMWIRNKKVELETDNTANFLNDAVKYGWCPDSWNPRDDGIYESKDKDAERLIEFQSISTFSNARGGSHPDTVMMLLDEFCPEDRKYPKMAAEGLMSLTKTVFSGRTDARLFCLSNFTEATNPYFVRFRIFPAKGRDITVFPDKRMLIERCSGYRKGIEQGNPWNDVYKGAGVLNYASEDEDAMMRMICRMPKGLKPAPYLVLIDGIYYRRWTSPKGVWWSEYNGNINGIVVYSPNLQECSDTVHMISRYLVKDINDCLEVGMLRFTHPNVMFAVLSMAYSAV